MQKVFVLKIEYYLLMLDTIVIEFVKIFETSHPYMSVDVVDSKHNRYFVVLLRN